jgi:hypothetical protein
VGARILLETLARVTNHKLSQTKFVDLRPKPRLRLESVLALRESRILLRLARRLRAALLLGQRASNRARLLLAKVERRVLRAAVRFAKRVELLLADNGERLSNRQSDLLDLAKLARGTARHLGHAKRRELLLEVGERRDEVRLGLRAQFVALEMHCVWGKRRETCRGQSLRER